MKIIIIYMNYDTKCSYTGLAISMFIPLNPQNFVHLKNFHAYSNYVEVAQYLYALSITALWG